MFSNEKGFILPPAVFISMIVFLVLYSQLQLYVSESRFYQSVKNYYEMEHLVETALVDIKQGAASGDTFGKTIVLSYPTGKVAYTAFPVNDRYIQVRISFTSLSQNQYVVLAEIERVSGKIVRWKKV